MKLIYHHRTQATDAQGIHIFEMIRAFERAGCSVQKVALVDREAIGEESRHSMLARMISHLPGLVYELLELGYNFVGTVRLVKAINAFKPDFIYERYSLYNIAGLTASRITGVPLILEVNSPLALEKKKYEKLFFKKIAQDIETYLFNRSYKVISVSNALKQIILKNGANGDNIVIMHNGVRLEDFREFKSPVVNSHFEPLVIGFIGWFKKWHGLSEVLQTFVKRHLFRNFNVEFLLVGDGPERKNIEQIIKEYKLEKKVHITGAVNRDNIMKYLQKIHIALQPAATEYSSPMKLIEYMAAGKAIIAPAQANIMELLTDQVDALLFSPGKWDELVEKVHILLKKPCLMASLGHKARQVVFDTPLSWDANAKSVIKLIQNNVNIS